MLKNITEYLVEEGDAEEEGSSEDSNTFEIDKELNKVKKLINLIFSSLKIFIDSRSFNFISTCCSFC